MTEDTLTLGELRQFTGSEHWYRHALNRNITFTDGVKFLADRAGAYWLIDEIALAQRYEAAVAAEEFQLWTLKVAEDRTAILTCEDGNCFEVFRKELDFTDFPLEAISLYCTDKVILLPSEY